MMMKRQDIKIATQKSNQLILAFDNLTSDTSVLETHKCHLLLLESPFRICALIPKKSCAIGHRIELYIVQNSLVSKTQIDDIRKHEDVIKLTSEVVDIKDFNETQNQVIFKLAEANEEKHREIEEVILKRQERFNELLKKFRNERSYE